MPDPCRLIQDEIEELKLEVKALQEELKTAAGTQKSFIIKEIRRVRADLIPRTRALKECWGNFVEPNVYQCDAGGLYYVREVGNNFYWFGERRDGLFANL